MQCLLRMILPYFALRGKGRNWKILFLVCFVFLFIHVYTWAVTSHTSLEDILENSNIFGTKYCKPQKNIVYIREFKCASTTLSNMFRRYGLENNLSFVLPKQKRIYLGWPYQIKHGYYRPSKTGEYNILCDFAVYNQDIFTSIMPENTVYVTSIREPFSNFKSMFNYYKVAQIASIPGKNTISEYLRTLPKYENIYKSHNASKTRYCVPDGFSMSKNLMSYCLGFQTGFPEGAPDFTNAGDQILNFINSIDHEFHLVMIVEYFDESLILLKRLLCWNFKDLVYQVENAGNYNYKNNEDPDLIAIYKNWSQIDYMLYNHFKEELTKRIEDQSDDFAGEVAHFKKVNSYVSEFCSKVESNPSVPNLVIDANRWSEGFQVNREFCKLIANEQLLEVVKEKYDSIPVLWEDEVPDKYFC